MRRNNEKNIIRLRYGCNPRTLRKRRAKGKLFRKKCEGCPVFEENKIDKDAACPVPYKDMSICPCQTCLVKVVCDRTFCNKFKGTKIR